MPPENREGRPEGRPPYSFHNVVDEMLLTGSNMVPARSRFKGRKQNRVAAARAARRNGTGDRAEPYLGCSRSVNPRCHSPYCGTDCRFAAEVYVVERPQFADCGGTVHRNYLHLHTLPLACLCDGHVIVRHFSPGLALGFDETGLDQYGTRTHS